MNVLTQLFVRMAEAGLGAGIAVLLILLCRPLFLKKMPGNICCVLWMLVFLRFLCPVTVHVALPVPEAWRQNAGIWETQQEVWQEFQREVRQNWQARVVASGDGMRGTELQAEDSQKSDAGGAAEPNAAAALKDADFLPDAVENKTAEAVGRDVGTALFYPVQILSLIWLGGAIVLLVGAAVRYISLKRRLCIAVRREFDGQEVWETDRIRDPFVMGIFRPEIYLPAGLSELEKHHIIAHERAHIERRDYLIKAVCYLGTVCHWMNPFAWIAFHFYTQDMEMACDERALRNYDREERLDYSRTLLMLAARKSGLKLEVFFGESNAKRRVENILRRKKWTLAGGCLTAILVCALAAVLFLRSGAEGGGASDTNAQDGGKATGANALDGGETGDSAADAAQNGETDNSASGTNARDGGNGAAESWTETALGEAGQQTPDSDQNEGGLNGSGAGTADLQEADYEKQRAETEKQLAELEIQIAAAEAAQSELLKEMEKAEEKQALIEENNAQTETLVELLNQRYLLQEKLRSLNLEISKYRIQEWAGYDLVKAQRQRLEALPSDLKAEEAAQYGAAVIRMEQDGGEARDGLHQFWQETEGKGKLPETLSTTELDGGESGRDTAAQDFEALYRTEKARTFLLGTETEDGDLILTSITAWGSGYLIIVDQSRDRNKSSDTADFSEYCYDRLHWLSSPKTDWEIIVASDESWLAFEDWEKSIASSTWDGRTDRVWIASFF